MDLLSDDLLRAPVNMYDKLRARSERGTAQQLQLAFLQHQLGKQAEVSASLSQLKPEAMEDNLGWQTLWYFLRGATASKDGQYEAATTALQTARAHAKAHGNRRLWVLSTQELAFNEALQERFEDAFTLLQDAYNTTAPQQHFELALIEQTLGGVNSYADNYAQALAYYQQALKRYQSLAYPTYIAETLQGIAATFRYQQEWDLALEAYEDYGRALTFQESVGSRFYYHYGKSLTFASSQRCQQALGEIAVALSLSGPLDYVGELFKKQASCAAQIGELALAEDALRNARQILTRSTGLDDTLWHAELIKIESDIALAAGDADRALTLFKRFHDVTQRLHIHKNSERVLALKSALDSARKDAQIEQLTQQAELQSLQLIANEAERQRSMLLMGGAVLILLLLIALFFYQRRRARLLYQLSVHDPLTNVFNRRHAIAIIEEWLNRSSHQHGGFCVLMIDIDHFKSINDTYGHGVGDELLVAISATLTSSLRPSDVLARFGGEEFILLLPRTQIKDAKTLAERVCVDVAQTFIENVRGERLNRTASIGLTNVTTTSDTLHDILSRADSAMYEAKAQGRNRVCVASVM
ncbi:diguanylate cyclase [Alteromonas oceanisediminis]|uniref:diguanylate cyclase n=1 Tax=Alteromonas oceanisediminis TaxID=2836180 RepID=UPI001BDA70AE|nr:tetratricopeptide repeat-containing diguanylate cyclase [Alteromonas oceanisediminis]MBT0586625.1 GGDEF domain-containing protein [Alteromonas oceanisediminis]